MRWRARRRIWSPSPRGSATVCPIAGVIGRAEIVDSLPANSISTFGGSPITTAGALANLDYLLDHDLQGNARVVGGWLLDRLRGAGVDQRPSWAMCGARG